jgi:Flp pilus assembly protein TadB
MFKFLPGILLIQLVTAGLVLLCTSWSQEPQLIFAAIAFGVIVAVLTTFWFGSVVQNIHASTHEKLKEKHAKDREKIIRRAEREKARVTSDSYLKIEKASKKASARANFKVGAYFAVATGAGAVMILSQLVTVGMMVLIASGSGLAGYLIRGRQDRLSRKNQVLLPKIVETAKKQIDAKKPKSDNTKHRQPE